ncbi:MAG: hypothetical protein LBG15_03555 [Dysgonamonadaceae bacterium]|jgi:hypothetical protein|nr:hypothetical protein [Dysgonamonadaceae bacterium]
MKKIIISVITVFLTLSAFAQTFMYTKSGQKIHFQQHKDMVLVKAKVNTNTLTQQNLFRTILAKDNQFVLAKIDTIQNI